MSPYIKALLLPEWFRTWLQLHLLPALNVSPYTFLFGVLKGAFDTVLLVFLGLGFMAGGNLYMETEYALPTNIQATVLEWAPVSNHIARKVDIPREVPLVLWFKENSMLSVNPDNCTGIIGAYDLVRSGERPCFTPGPVSRLEVTEQLTIGAMEFKKRCPDITYWTQDPETIKRCYFAYNAGMGAASRLDPNDSAYVMNNYDEAHTGMIYSDIELGTVRMKTLGAWPAHLSFQSLVVSQLDVEQRPFSLALIDLSTRIFDRTYGFLTQLGNGSIANSDVKMAFPENRRLKDTDCIGDPHLLGRFSLRPRLNPVTESPILTQDLHGCSYSLPGVDISSNNSLAVLQTPMPGKLTTFTDRWYNSTIRIENDEWIVWMLHPRSYLVREGQVERGEAVGVMGAVGIATGPHVHYTIYDKVNETFVDPRLFLP